MAAIVNQEQQRVAIGPGNWHFIYVRQVSYDAATMQRSTCGHEKMPEKMPEFYILIARKIFFSDFLGGGGARASPAPVSYAYDY